jgi:hypothetical protein
MLTSESTKAEKQLVRSHRCTPPRLHAQRADRSPLPHSPQINKDLASGHPRTRLLYVTPETFRTEGFMRNLRIVHEQGELNRLVVDEVRPSAHSAKAAASRAYPVAFRHSQAHCISEWGPSAASCRHCQSITTDVVALP